MSGIVKFIGLPRVELLTPQEVRASGSDEQLYRTTRPFTCICEQHGTIRVPEGFVTNWASVPGLALAYLDDEAPAVAFPSLIHDYLYSIGGRLSTHRVLSREQVDDLFYRSMLACGARSAQAWIAHRAVRLGGGKHWKS